MSVPEEYMEIHRKFDRALKNGSLDEVRLIPVDKLRMAKAHLIPDRNSPYYQLLLDVLTEQEQGQSAVFKEEIYEIIAEELPKKPVTDPSKSYRCFVIMPIGEKGTIQHKNNMLVYRRILVPCIESCGHDIKCYHSELINDPGAIPDQIIRALKDDDIVIADLRRTNPNVIWELGVRHAFRKRSIMIFSEQKEAFFDTSIYRMAQYHVDGQSNVDFCNRLHSFIDHIVQKPSFPDNPVWQVLGNENQNSGAETANPLPNANISVDIGYEKVHYNENLHQYSLSFGIANKGKEAIKDLLVELFFPREYLKDKRQDYDHLKSEDINEDGKRYEKFTFDFSALPERAQKIYRHFLFPGNVLWLFRKDGDRLAVFEYFVDQKSWANRDSYHLKWNVFVNGTSSSNGSIAFSKLQMF